MILNDKIKIKIGNYNQINYYKDKGFDCKINDIIEIDISILPKNSHIKIMVKCENCGVEKLIMYSDYIKCVKKQNIYFCSKCKRIKTNKTNIEKYGFLTNLKCDDTKDKIKKTCLDKYKIDNYAKTIECKEKIIATNFEKYGVKHFTQSDEYKNKIIVTNLKKYGVKYFITTDIFKKSRIKSNLEKYGFEHPMQNKDFFENYQINKFKLKLFRDIITYQGSYELDFLEKYYDKIEIKKIASLKYLDNDKIRFYHPDFYLPEYNLIVEIKSKYTYEIEKEQNEFKKNGALENGYNFIFIIDKEYTNFNHIIH